MRHFSTSQAVLRRDPPFTANSVPMNLGGTAARILGEDCDGEVIAVFTRAVYLSLGDEVIALVPAEVCSGPLHVRIEELPKATVGMPATTRGGSLALAGRRVMLPTELWEPTVPADVMAARPLMCRLVEHEPVLDISSGAPVDVGAWLAPELARGDLAAACSMLIGRGSGLTPAGDDVASGMLLVSALAGDVDPVLLDAIAANAPTHLISRAFLREAARGRSIEPAHCLLSACTAGDSRGAQDALGRLAAIGHTSGLDLAKGMSVALVSMAARAASAERALREISSIHAHSVL